MLIAAPQATGVALDPDLVGDAAERLGSSFAWLHEGVACDIAVPDWQEPDTVRAELTALIGDAPIDAAVVPTQNRRKRLLIADMDSTMIEQECIDELAAEAGRGEEVAKVTAAAMRGEIPFDRALRDRVGTLRGLETSVVDRVLAERTTLRAGGHELLATMRANGAYTMLVSGGFTAFTGPIAERLGFHENRANELLTSEGRFTGEAREPILGRDAKLAALREACERLGLIDEDVLAVGDGANDGEMVAAAGLGVALHAKPALVERANARIDHGDLTALLYLQGYRHDEFVAR